MSQVRVLIAEAHQVYRQALQDVLETDALLAVVGLVGNEDSLLARAAEVEPEIVLMNANLPRSGGFQACRTLRARLPASQVCLIVSRDSVARAEEAFAAGAAATFLPDASPGDLIRGLHAVGQGHMFWRGRVVESSDEDERLDDRPGQLPLPSRAAGSRPGGSLSPRLLEILDLYIAGCDEGEIARRLDLSHQALRGYAAAILRETGASEMGQAQAVVRRRQAPAAARPRAGSPGLSPVTTTQLNN